MSIQLIGRFVFILIRENKLKPKERQEYTPFVLVIEDDETSLSIYSRMLKNVVGKQGVIAFTDARKALYFLEKQLKNQEGIPSAILLDVHMPYMDGWQFLDIVQNIPQLIKNPPIIWLCSSDSSTYTFQKSLEQAFVERFLNKPLLLKDFTDFSQAITRNLNTLNRRNLNGAVPLSKHPLAFFPLLEVYPMSEKKFEKIILTARSSIDLGLKIDQVLEHIDDPVVQAETLLEVFRTLEYFAKKVFNSREVKKDALLQLLHSYVGVIDVQWTQLDTDGDVLVNSYFYLYLAEKDLFKYRYHVLS